jgi:hypothetical protein
LFHAAKRHELSRLCKAVGMERVENLDIELLFLPVDGVDV